MNDWFHCYIFHNNGLQLIWSEPLKENVGRLPKFVMNVRKGVN